MEVAGVLLVPTPINHLEHSSPLHNRFRVYGPRIKCVIAKTFSKKKKKKVRALEAFGRLNIKSLNHKYSLVIKSSTTAEAIVCLTLSHLF